MPAPGPSSCVGFRGAGWRARVSLQRPSLFWGGSVLGRVGAAASLRHTTARYTQAQPCACPITCQSTRTHNSRRRLRRWCWWSGHFYVVRHWRRMHSASKAVARAALSAPADGVACVSLRASGSHFSGGCVFPLGRVGAHASMRVRSVQSHGKLACDRQCGRFVRLHTLGVGAQAGLRQSGAMPPSPRQHSLRKVRLGAPAWLALASTAAYNRSIDTDAQVRPRAARAAGLGRRSFSRYL